MNPLAGLAALVTVLAALLSPGGDHQVEVQNDLVYSRPDGVDVALDLYTPSGAGDAARPAVVVVHGGGWQVGDKSGVTALSRSLASQGWVVAAVNYRLHSDHPWPDQLTDVTNAVRWLQDHADEHGIEADRIAILGGSAGGQLAMLVGTNGTGTGHAPLRAVASWSGPTDLRTIQPASAPVGTAGQPSGSATAVPVGCGTDPYCIGLTDPGVISTFLGCALQDCPERYAAASPAVQVGPGTAPMLLVNSESELVPVSQLYEMANSLNQSGVRAELLIVAGSRHADAYADVALGPTIDFLRGHLDGDLPATVSPRSPPTTAAGSVALPSLQDGWRLPDAADDLPRSLRGTAPWWRQPVVLAAAAVALALGTAVVLVRRRGGRTA